MFIPIGVIETVELTSSPIVQLSGAGAIDFALLMRVLPARGAGQVNADAS